MPLVSSSFSFPHFHEAYLKWLNEIFKPVSEPQWTTPNKVRLNLGNARLRDFSTGKDKSAILISPPQAGHHSCIADYDHDQSLVEAALRSGKNSVYAIEWKSATPEQRYKDIGDCILTMKKCVEKIGTKVTLIGLCQGGWQSAIYAALYPEDVESMILAAAPIDFHAGCGFITCCAHLYPLEFYEWFVRLGLGVLDGRVLLTGFKMMNPFERFWGDFAEMFEHINDGAYMKRYRKFKNWYEYTQNLPGRFYLQVVKELFKENKLVKGELEILGREVKLSGIDQPLVLVAGEKDEITPAPQLFAAENYVSTSPENITKMTVPGGHIGVFTGTKIIRDYWPKIFGAI